MATHDSNPEHTRRRPAPYRVTITTRDGSPRLACGVHDYRPISATRERCTACPAERQIGGEL